MRKFILKILTIFFLVLMITSVINFIFIKNDKSNSENINKFYEVPQKIAVCNFGSSHGLYGFNYENYQNKNNCFNFSLHSQPLDYDFRIMQQYQNSINENTKVYIVISYFSLFGVDYVNSEIFDSLNKRYFLFLSPQYIRKFDTYNFLIIKYFPLLDDYNKIYRLLKGELAFDNSEAIWKKRADEIDVLKDSEEAYNRHIYKEFDENGKRKINDREVDALVSMINLCKEKKAKVVLITTPYLSEYTDYIKEHDPKFFNDYYNLINRISRDNNVPYYDYAFDKRFSGDHSLFMNADHLNKDGALKFTNILNNET